MSNQSFLIVLLTFFAININAQDLAKKYKTYKTRFETKFINHGTEIGQTIPAGHADFVMPCSQYWLVKADDCNSLKNRTKKGYVSFKGDATVYLAHYLAVLATEYELADKYNIDKKQTIKQIYDVLMTFERLNTSAEQRFDKNYPNKINAFFLREDIPENFEQKEDGSLRFEDINCVVAYDLCKPNSKKEEFGSKDQIIHLMLGYSIAYKLLPNNLVYNNVNLKEKVKQTVDAILEDLDDNSWVIKNPAGMNPAFGNMQFESRSLNKMSQNLFNKKRGNSLFGGFWKLAANTLLRNTDDNKVMTFILSSLGNMHKDKWYKEKSQQYDLALFYLINTLLYDKKIEKSFQNNYLLELNNAPFTGNCYKTADCNETPKWSTTNRWIKPEKNNGHKHFQGQFNGLDFMLFCNLYHILYEK